MTIDAFNPNGDMLLEPNATFVEKYLVGKAIMKCTSGHVPIRVINISVLPYTVHVNTVVALDEPIDEVFDSLSESQTVPVNVEC